MKIDAIVQARMGSSRLPGKTLLKIGDQTMLAHVVNRLERSQRLSQVVVATSTSDSDRQIIEYMEGLDKQAFTGSEADVLDRYMQTALAVKSELIVRITGDCPLIDPLTIDDMINFHLQQNADYTGNLARRTLPRGLDAEIFSVHALRIAHEQARKPHHREHVTPYFYENPDKFNVASYEVKGELRRPDLRLCVDTQEDLDLLQEIYKRFFTADGIIDVRVVIGWLDANPYWRNYNAKAEKEHLDRNAKDGVQQVTLDSMESNKG